MKRLRSVPVIEAVEALLLGTVAVATAFSGYQAALANTESAQLCSEASRDAVLAQGAQTRSGQESVYDATTFNEWLIATQAGNTRLADTLLKRFRPEYRTAFEAWLATNPLTNPSAPAGPGQMPGHQNEGAREADMLAGKAAAAQSGAAEKRNVSDEYVRVTVILAVVLFLAALAQRFSVPRVRMVIVALALGTFTYGIVELLSVNH